MLYNFSNLSPADFEDLARDLVGREIGARFESFAAGPDGGMDGRHAKADGNLAILQAKHYVGSTYQSLRAQIKQELTSIRRLSPTRYILVTSRPLSPRNKAELSGILAGLIQEQQDILGPEDLNGLLRKFPEVEKSHIKLWLSSTAMLETILRSAAHSVRAMTIQEIQLKVRLYAQNPSFDQAHETLETRRILIIAGPPGVGKTTLGEMLTYAYIGEGWELVVIRSLDDGFASIDDTQRQVFYFDDFLGRVALDRRGLAYKDSDIARLIRRVSASPNARFILTTRAYIFEEARQISEHLADRRLDLAKYLLDVGVYTRQIKARIIYNHLIACGTSQGQIDALITSGKIPQIVDHPNYNPRIVEWMTDYTHIGEIPPVEYPAAFLETLQHPKKLWDVAFRTHIPRRCQHCLFALFFCSQYFTELMDLRTAFESLHSHLSAKYGQSRDSKDFEESIRTLEGSFISIRGSHVNFINPSLRDYLTSYLNDDSLLEAIASSAVQSQVAQAIWHHARTTFKSPSRQKLIARAFAGVSEVLLIQPVFRTYEDGGRWYRSHDAGLSNTDRLDLLLDWFCASGDDRFAQTALKLAQNPVEGLDSSYDGEKVLRLIGHLKEEGYYEGLSVGSDIAEALETAFSSLLNRGIPTDKLESIFDAAERHKDSLSDATWQAVQEAVHREFEDVRQNAADLDSESTLEDYIIELKALSTRAGVAIEKTEKAVALVRARISELQDETPESVSPTIRPRQESVSPVFDDASIANLFAPLLSKARS